MNSTLDSAADLRRQLSRKPFVEGVVRHQVSDKLAFVPRTGEGPALRIHGCGGLLDAVVYLERPGAKVEEAPGDTRERLATVSFGMCEVGEVGILDEVDGTQLALPGVLLACCCQGILKHEIQSRNVHVGGLQRSSLLQ